MRNALYQLGPFTLLVGHDVGIGHGALGVPTVLVGRAWGLAIGPVAVFYTQNVTRDALRLRPQDVADALAQADDWLP